MSIVHSFDTTTPKIFHSLTDPSSLPPIGALTTAIAATLVVGLANTIAGSVIWSFDRYVTPSEHPTLGTGDHIAVYRHIHNHLVYPLPLPIFTAKLHRIVAWGHNHIEFSLRGLITEVILEETIQLPSSIIRLSTSQHLRRMLCPLPRCSPASKKAPHCLPPHPRFKGDKAIGDRVPRDSDDLPIWDKHRKL
ncbi:hypothetical protein EV424DRAFT_1609121 [Suillus variegatus]|nr:hypothetical protein EV424DRAFT_1609121 [Suillus variegatus]